MPGPAGEMGPPNRPGELSERAKALAAIAAAGVGRGAVTAAHAAHDSGAAAQDAFASAAAAVPFFSGRTGPVRPAPLLLIGLYACRQVTMVSAECLLRSGDCNSSSSMVRNHLFYDNY